MEYVILFLLAASVWHFLYDGIIAPSARLEIRLKALQVRHDLNSLKAERGQALKQEHFDYLRGMVLTVINEHPRFDLVTFVSSVREFHRNDDLRARLRRTQNTWSSCDMEAAKKIHRRAIVIADRAFVVNSFAWAIYLIPAVLMVACFSMVKAKVTAILSLSQPDFDRLATHAPVTIATS